MKMELIQPFINAADAVLSQGLKSPIVIGNLSMEEEAYRRKGVAGVVQLTGDIEGRVIFDLAPKTAAQVASYFAGTELPESDDLVREAVCELANQVIGNAVATLNDRSRLDQGTEDTEALVLCFETASGQVYMNIALRYGHSAEPTAKGVGV